MQKHSPPGLDHSSVRPQVIYRVLQEIGGTFGVIVERAMLDFGSLPLGERPISTADPYSGGHALEGPTNEGEFQAGLISAGRQLGMVIRPIAMRSSGELLELVRRGYPVVLAEALESDVDVLPVHVLTKTTGRKFEITTLEMASRNGEPGDEIAVDSKRWSKRKLDQTLRTNGGQLYVAKEELECDPISLTSDHKGGHQTGHGSPDEHGEDHDHLTPLSRFLGLLRLDRRDIGLVMLFAFVAGILSLATPLAIESMVHVVSWGTYLQPLLVLAVILLACLGISAILKVLQTIVVEVIQRRQLVRIVSDLAHRFPRANRASLTTEYPRELANRVFDIMTIQKATAVLLLDGVSIVLTTGIGLLLLAFYHPFLLGFDIVLVLVMVLLTILLGRGGVRTAVAESIVKYRIAHWLQDVIDSPTAFKINGGESLAIDRANRLSTDYLNARSKQFRVVLRQVVFAASLQVIASTVLLGLGGWLVIQRQLTLGQLVASELVVTVVVSSFAKAGKSLEKFFDLMAGIDKVGHLLDVSVDPRGELGKIESGPVGARWDDLTLTLPTGSAHLSAATVAPGSSVAIVGDDIDGKRALARAMAGLFAPKVGTIEIGGFDPRHAAGHEGGELVGFAGSPEVFHGTMRENVDLGRASIGRHRVREVLQQVGLWDTAIRLRDGMGTTLQTGGYPLTRSQCDQLMLARAMAAGPRLLIIDGLLDHLSQHDREIAFEALLSETAPWTLIVITDHDDVAARMQEQLFIRDRSGKQGINQ